MPVLDRNELEQSPLADLHAIASELGIEGYRRLRRDDLIDALLSGETPVSEPSSGAKKDSDDDSEGATRTRRRRGGRGRGRRDDEEAGDNGGGGGGGGGRPSRSPKPSSRRDADERDVAEEEEPEAEGEPRTGILDVLPNGSGFMRADAFVHSDDDVYVSPAQIRRCELRSGDEITGPVRAPRRSERHPSLQRVAQVNGAEPEPPAERKSFDELTPVFATQKLTGLGDIPYGRGSRVAIGGPPGAGATSLLRDAVDALRKEDDIELVVVLAGARPEEVTEWRRLDGVQVAGSGYDRSIDEQAQIADLAVERAKRIVERGGHAALVIDSLDALPPAAARRVFGAARSTEEGGSLTIVAATGLAAEPQRVATTRVLLEADGTRNSASGTLRAELLK
ncbi:MAG: transcription termination factor Rho [Thermoleophilales bacterium]|nr:transcription termination factor Rho [Thermoleophilales bacterium]